MRIQRSAVTISKAIHSTGEYECSRQIEVYGLTTGDRENVDVL